MKPTLLIVASLLLTGCTNVFKTFYEPEDFHQPLALASYSGSTQIIRPSDMNAASNRLTDQGYGRIGSSRFTGTGRVTEAQLRSEAKRVGADIVLWTASYDGNMPQTQVIPIYTPGTTSTTNASGSLYGNNGAGAVYSGSSTTTTSGTFSTQVIQGQAAVFSHYATFWRKLKP